MINILSFKNNISKISRPGSVIIIIGNDYTPVAIFGQSFFQQSSRLTEGAVTRYTLKYARVEQSFVSLSIIVQQDERGLTTTADELYKNILKCKKYHEYFHKQYDNLLCCGLRVNLLLNFCTQFVNFLYKF